MRTRFQARFHWQTTYVIHTSSACHPHVICMSSGSVYVIHMGQQLCIKPIGFLVVFKAVLSHPINIIFCHFHCIFRALWLIPSWSTGTPSPLCVIHMGRIGACVHGEVNVTFNALFLLKMVKYFNFHLCSSNQV